MARGCVGQLASENELTPAGDYFHSSNLENVQFYLPTHRECGTTTQTANRPPEVDAGIGGWIIPASTPFELTGTGFEPDGDEITFTWEQVDLAGQPSNTGDGDLGDVPLFRSLPPGPSPSRSFPADPLAPGLGEILPTTTRNLTFRLIGRDNVATGGAWDFDEISILVDSNSGPFVNTTSPMWAWPSKEVTWDVGDTDLPPISCGFVDILLSRDGGATFDEELVMGTPNDGIETVAMPSTTSPTNARVRVRCAGQIFFSDAVASLEPFSFAPYQFLVDRLQILHSGGTLFVDEFDDELPPPSVGYAVDGTVGPEAGGFLLLDEIGAVSGIDGSLYQSAAQDIQASLTEDLLVSSLFRVVLPNAIREDAQSVFLTYVDPDRGELHKIIASFAAAPSLSLALEVRDENWGSGTVKVLSAIDASAVVDAGIDAVEVRLEVPAGTQLAGASLIGFDNGVEVGRVTATDVVLIPSATVSAAGVRAAVVPEPGLIGSVMLGVLSLSVRFRARTSSDR